MPWEKQRDPKYAWSSPIWDTHVKADYEYHLHSFFPTSEDYVSLEGFFSSGYSQEGGLGSSEILGPPLSRVPSQ